MSRSTDELTRRGDALAASWKQVTTIASLDALIEFAVSISSFTEFLHARGLPGLHQMARNLEQQTLSLLDDGGSTALERATSPEMSRRIQELVQRVRDYAESRRHPLAERRSHAPGALVPDAGPRQRVWLLGSAGAAWQELVLQLGYFNIDAEFQQMRNLPGQYDEPVIVVLDGAGSNAAQVCTQIEALRQRLPAGKLLLHGYPSDFESVRAALNAGCDFCFGPATTQSTILGRIIELCGNRREEPYRALVVEDSVTASVSIQRTLAMIDVQTCVVDQPQAVLENMAAFRPDLILMDMFMPGCTGIEAARVIRQHPEFLSIPIVYLSGDTNIPMQIDALRLGGDHFLTKPYNPVVLNAVVQSKIERYRTLRRAMQRDSLTGLYNHSTSKEQLGLAIGQARDGDQPLSVAMLDIDHFKKINDSHGHPMGDQVIRNLGWFLRQRLRGSDVIGRYGGEEFLVVLPGADIQQATGLLDRIRQDFGQIRHPLNETWCTATLSGGVTQLRGEAGAQLLIKQADEALYTAKHEGRDRIVSWR